MRTAPLLFARLPHLAGRMPWVGLADGAPTAIERLPLFDLPRFFVKRDDRTSAIYGGNKVRKLEWILGDALARGARGVVTFGAWGSHHALSTAIFARRLGLEATLVLYPQPPTPHVREQLLADLATGARVRACRSAVTAPFAALCAMLFRRPRPYFVAPGGSDARGTLGYVECALEVADDVRAGRAPAPDLVYCAAGTGGTAAGLLLGLAVAGLRATVVAVRVVPKPVVSVRRIRALAAAAARRIGVRAALGEVVMLDDHLGAGYGHETAEGREAVQLAGAAGIQAEPTYTGKTLAGLRAFAAAGGRRDAVHLYVHTHSSADIAGLVARGDPSALPRALRFG